MGQQVKGMVLKSRLDFLEHVYGTDAHAKVVTYLTGRTKEALSKPQFIKASSWYDFQVQAELDKAICKAMAGGDAAVYRQMGAFSNQFQAAAAAVDHFENPWKWFKFHVIAFPRFYNPGRLEVVKLNEGECFMRFHDTKTTKENCETNIGFTKKGLEMCGCTDVDVVETKCTAKELTKFCEFHITFKWDPSSKPKLF